MLPHPSAAASASASPLAQALAVVQACIPPTLRLPAGSVYFNAANKLGEGSFGLVYRGTLTLNGRTDNVAIKQLKLSVLDMPSDSER